MCHSGGEQGRFVVPEMPAGGSMRLLLVRFRVQKMRPAPSPNVERRRYCHLGKGRRETGFPVV
jgi:hypothetical protein